MPKKMECPFCGSGRVRKASVVYEEGTRDSVRRTRGTAFGVGVSRRRVGVGVGVFGSRSTGRSSSVAAQRADKARIVWWGLQETLGLFIILSVIFFVLGVPDPFTIALAVAIGVMVGCPILTGIWAAHANQDYDRRWYCGACGALWTVEEPSTGPLRSAIVDEPKVPSSRPSSIFEPVEMSTATAVNDFEQPIPSNYPHLPAYEELERGSGNSWRADFYNALSVHKGRFTPEWAVPPPRLRAGKLNGRPETAVDRLNSTLRALGGDWVIIGPAGRRGDEYGLFAAQAPGCPPGPRRYLSSRAEQSDHFRAPLERARAKRDP
jgi:hypothetical protein